MRLTYYGHSSFLVETADDLRVILDPYRPGSYQGTFKHAPIDEPADVVVATHVHDDHGGVDTIPGRPKIFVHPIDEMVGRLRITGFDVAHDENGGSKRGKNTMVILDDGDIRLLHAGDLGHTLDKVTVEALGSIQILLVPVGGFYTIDAKQAAAVVDAMNPLIVIPMHYKTPKVDFPIAPVDPFLAMQKDVERKEGCVLEATRETLPGKRLTIVLTACR